MVKARPGIWIVMDVESEKASKSITSAWAKFKDARKNISMRGRNIECFISNTVFSMLINKSVVGMRQIDRGFPSYKEGLDAAEKLGPREEAGSDKRGKHDRRVLR